VATVRARRADPAGRWYRPRRATPASPRSPREAWERGRVDHDRAGRGRAAQPAAALAVRHRAAQGHHRRQRRGAGDRQRRPVGLGEAPQNWQVLGASVAGSAACLEGPLARRRARPVGRPGRDLAVIDRAVAGQRCRQGRPRLRAVTTWRVPGPSRCRPWSRCPWASRTRSRRPARAGVAEGFRTLKHKVGTDAATDVARVRAAREGAGPDVALRVDANTGWDCFEAVRVIRALEDAGVGCSWSSSRSLRRDLGPGPRAPARRDPGDGRRVHLRPRRPRGAGPSRGGRHGQRQARHGGGLTPALELAAAHRGKDSAVSVGCMLESAVG
jgi:hypothetical protein